MSEAAPNPWRRRLLLGAPLIAAAGAGVGFLAMLRGLTTGSYDPRGVPSALLGKPAPDWAIPPLAGAETPALTPADLKAPGRPILVNFFASWCVPCVIEHPQLVALNRRGVPLYGVAYKDKARDALGFLARHGNPFSKLAADEGGRAAIEWGLYGVPETYLIDKAGIIRWRWAGPMTEDTVSAELDVLLRRYA